jgi:exonuclease VII small subunit
MYTKKSAFFFINVFFITLFSFIAHLAIAQEDTGTSSATEEATVGEPRGERPQIVPNSRALSTQMQTRIINLAANISNRMDAALARLDAIVLRIESRTQKLADAGYTVDAILPLIDEAKASLDKARTQLEGIDAHVNKTVSSESPQVEWQKLRQAFTTIKEDLNTAKESLRKAVAEMKTGAEINGVNEAVESSAATSEVTNE